MLLKRTLFCVFGVMQCVYAVRGSKKHIIFHILYIIVAPLCSAFLKIFTKLIVLRSEVCSDWPAIQSIVSGRIPQACDGNVTPLTVLWWRVPGRRDKTKTIKPTINEVFVAFSGDIITVYNDLYCLFMCCAAPRKHYHVCICYRRNAKQALLYTAQNSRLNCQ